MILIEYVKNVAYYLFCWSVTYAQFFIYSFDTVMYALVCSKLEKRASDIYFYHI